MKILIEQQDGETESEMVDCADLIAKEWWGQNYEIELKFQEGSKFMRREMTEEDIRKFILPTYKL